MSGAMTDRELVNDWLDRKSEHDPASRAEVIDACKTPEGRAYYVGQAKIVGDLLK